MQVLTKKHLSATLISIKFKQFVPLSLFVKTVHIYAVIFQNFLFFKKRTPKPLIINRL